MLSKNSVFGTKSSEIAHTKLALAAKSDTFLKWIFVLIHKGSNKNVQNYHLEILCSAGKI
jgi:hypothetical protein